MWTLCTRDIYELLTLGEEFSADMLIRDCLKDLVVKRAAVAKNAALGKSRDDARGSRIIPDYHRVHKPADEEKIVVLAQRCVVLSLLITMLLERLTTDRCAGLCRTASDVKTRVARFLNRM